MYKGLLILLAAALAGACTADRGGSESSLSTIDGRVDAGSNGGVCVPVHTVPVRITSGAETQVATMTIETSATNIEITIVAEAGWLLGDTYVVIGHDGSFVQFTENETPWIDGYVSMIQFDIPLGDAGLECGDIFKLIVQLHVKEISTDNVFFASAVGGTRLVPSTDGWKEFYEVCCEEAPDAGVPGDDAGVPGEDAGVPGDGCTLTQGFWRNHEWPGGTEQLEIGGTIYTRDELLAYISGGTGGNACIILGQQLIAALINVLNGADPILAIASAEAAWDASCTPLGTFVAPSSTTGQILIAFSEILTDYNEGGLGPGHCDQD